MAKAVEIEPVDYDNLARVARIVGGGAEMAINKYNALKAEGKNPSLWLDRKNHTWVVQHDQEKPT